MSELFQWHHTENDIISYGILSLQRLKLWTDFKARLR